MQSLSHAESPQTLPWREGQHPLANIGWMVESRILEKFRREVAGARNTVLSAWVFLSVLWPGPAAEIGKMIEGCQQENVTLNRRCDPLSLIFLSEPSF